MTAHGDVEKTNLNEHNGSLKNDEDEDMFEQDLSNIINRVGSGFPSAREAIYKPSVAASGGNVHGGGGGMQSIHSPAKRSSQPSHTSSFEHPVPPATINIPLSSPERNMMSSANSSGNNSGSFGGGSGAQSPVQGTVDTLKEWSTYTLKYTKQWLVERFGRGSKTIDLELEAQIEALRETQRRYLRILQLARTMTQHFHQVIVTQSQLGEAFSDMSQKSPELQQEFAYNAETQKALFKNGETLCGALNFFTSSVNTLCNKTMEDTIMTVHQYGTARLEYDAYRTDLEQLRAAPRDSSTVAKIEDADKKYQFHKEKFERLRANVAIKLKFLEENKVKVMHKQLLLFHNAIAAYFSGNQAALEATLKQFNIKLKSPNTATTSWLEHD